MDNVYKKGVTGVTGVTVLHDEFPSIHIHIADGNCHKVG